MRESTVVEDFDSDSELEIFNISHKYEKAFKLNLRVEDKVITFELDTGSPISAISDKFYQQYLHSVPLNTSKLNLKTYAGEVLNVVGTLFVKVKYEDAEIKLQLFIIKNGGPPILGRDWIAQLKISVDQFLL